MKVVLDKKYGAQMLHAEWNAVETAPALEVISHFSTRDRMTDFSNPSNPDWLEHRLRTLYTAATDLIPNDGIVRETAVGIVKGAQIDVDKARAIYEWIVENTSRNPKTRGCGLGNIRFMLESGDLSGKCADLNALYVGLCRSIGILARDVYGVRVADSRYGTRVWEMNWMLYNATHDVELPNSKGPTLGFLMYPQAETGGKRLDSLDPKNFRYALTARETGT